MAAATEVDAERQDPAWADRVVANDPLVYRTLHQIAFAPRRTDPEYEDWLQNGRIGLMRAARTWDPARGKWTVYAVACIRTAMLTADRVRYRRERGLQFLPLDSVVVSPRGDVAVLADALPDPHAQEPLEAVTLADLDIEAIAHQILTTRQYAVWRERGQTQAQIGAILHISQSLVSRYQKQIQARWHEWWTAQQRG